MYLEYYNLREKPFSYIIPDPSFFYYAPQYLSVKRKCDYVVSERAGHIYIFGPIGSGKTTLLKNITQALYQDDVCIPNFINSPNLKTPNALLRRICDGYKIKTEKSYDSNLINFTNWLAEKYGEGKFPVLTIDEAQNVPREGLKLLHYLMTYVTSKNLLLMIILCGQEELASRIDRFPEIKSRMLPSALAALTLDETIEMIKFRWKKASKDPIPFEESAIKAIFTYSLGLPREICKFCEIALMVGFNRQTKSIGVEIIDLVAKDQGLIK